MSSISILSNYDNIIKCIQPSCDTKCCTSLCTFPCTLWCTQCSNQRSSISPVIERPVNCKALKEQGTQW